MFSVAQSERTAYTASGLGSREASELGIEGSSFVVAPSGFSDDAPTRGGAPGERPATVPPNPLEWQRGIQMRGRDGMGALLPLDGRRVSTAGGSSAEALPGHAGLRERACLEGVRRRCRCCVPVEPYVPGGCPRVDAPTPLRAQYMGHVPAARAPSSTREMQASSATSMWRPRGTLVESQGHAANANRQAAGPPPSAPAKMQAEASWRAQPAGGAARATTTAMPRAEAHAAHRPRSAARMSVM